MLKQEQNQLDRIIENVEKVIVGKRLVIKKMLAAMLANGHILLEDVPGVGKTRMVKALARSISGQFKRIQFTPDLLPSDGLGVSVFNQRTMEFEFKPGPIITHILLADEINRTSPKTQSALLEAMEERSVTVDGTTIRLESPFMVLATQNPMDYEGTYSLPEAQMDRFMLKLQLGYPEKQDELEILSRATENREALLPAVCFVQDILRMQKQVEEVHVDDTVKEYIVEICRQTRSHRDILLGVSPRGTVALYKAAQAWAYLQRRHFVTPDDVKELAGDVLLHRLVIRPEGRFEGLRERDILAEIMDSVKVPVAREKRKRFW